jgi:site-specific DNA-methyltransferase (adenine-specific)
MADNSVDSIVTDPPYGLSFMGKDWDHGVPGEAFWREALRVAKPGAHLLAFGGTRTHHRLMCAIEDAGWEIRDCLGWLYGSGFPKSLDVSKAIDKQAGAEREVVGRYRAAQQSNNCGTSFNASNADEKGVTYALITAPATPEAVRWNGWGTALKPAWEPIVLARKPLRGTVAQNVLEHGTGALNIDGCRVGTETIQTNGWGNCEGVVMVNRRMDYIGAVHQGRFPANLIHDGSEDVLEVFPNGTQRFFYCAKASPSERGEGNSHPTVKPLALMRYLCRLVTPPGGIVLDPFAGSGSTGKACALEGFRFICIERETEYCKIAEARIASVDVGLFGAAL